MRLTLIIFSILFLNGCFLKVAIEDFNSSTSNSPPAVVPEAEIPSPLLVTLIDPQISISNQFTQRIQFVGLMLNEEIFMFSDPLCSQTLQNFIASGDTMTLTSTLVTDGTYAFHYRRGSDLTCVDTQITYQLDTVAPTALINNAPTITDSTFNLNVTIAGEGTQSYFYKIEDTTGLGCQNLSGYNVNEISVMIPITDNIGPLSDGVISLCVLGKDLAGNIQTQASVAQWQKVTSGTGVGTGLTATLSNTPSPTSDSDQLNISVSGTNVTQYKYKVGMTSTTNCNSIFGYSGAMPVATPIAEDISTFDDGSVTLCVLGVDSLNMVQDLSSPTTYNWTRNSPAKIIFTQLNESLDEDLVTSASFVLKLNHRKSDPITLEFDTTGSAQPSIDFNLTRGTITIPPQTLYHTEYFNLLGNIISNTDRLLTINIIDIPSQNAQMGNIPVKNFRLMDNDGPFRSQILSFALGINHGCLIYTDNRLFCWGDNSYGQLGDGTTNHSETPVYVGPNYLQVSVLGDFTCALNTSHRVYCWGYNNRGQLGVGNNTNYSIPQPVDGPISYSKISTGQTHTCGITTLGVLKCWGDNTEGALGDGTQSNKLSPTEIDNTQTYINLSLGLDTTCAIRTNNKLFCWGENANAYLGMGWSTDFNILVPTAVDPTEDYQKVSMGYFDGCGITTNNDLKCWGRNYAGEAGVPQSIYLEFPTLIEVGTKYMDVSMGIETSLYEPHACGVTQLGVLKCWGYAETGGVGANSDIYNPYHAPPSVVDPGVAYQKAFVSEHISCGWQQDGDVKCWGLSEKYVFPFEQPLIKTPRLMNTQISFEKVFMSDANCYLDSEQKLLCQGMSSLRTDWASITKRDSNAKYQKYSLSGSMGCGILDNGEVKCTGLTTYPVSLTGGTNQYLRTDFVTITAGTTYKDLSHSGLFGCFINSSDDLLCWGYDNQGQVGDGNGNSATDLPLTHIAVGTKFKMVKCGGSFTCAIDFSDHLLCWGMNGTGTLGDNTTTSRDIPTPSADVGLFKFVDAGSTNACAITSDDHLKCWGSRYKGYNGDGFNSMTSVNIPTLIDSSETYSKVSVGGTFSCGLTTSNRVKCWGDNTGFFGTGAGMVGVGSGASAVVVPTFIVSTDTFKDVSIKDDRACAITTGGAIVCWGKQYSIYGGTPIHPVRQNVFLPTFIMDILRL